MITLHSVAKWLSGIAFVNFRFAMLAGLFGPVSVIQAQEADHNFDDTRGIAVTMAITSVLVATTLLLCSAGAFAATKSSQVLRPVPPQAGAKTSKSFLVEIIPEAAWLGAGLLFSAPALIAIAILESPVPLELMNPQDFVDSIIGYGSVIGVSAFGGGILSSVLRAIILRVSI